MTGKPNTKMFETMVRKHGSEEAARKWFAEIGAKGGRHPTTGGFAGDRELARIAGAKGGRISKRRSKKTVTRIEVGNGQGNHGTHSS